MRIMSPKEVDAFLSQGTRTGKLATVCSDGRPHVTPVWLVIDPATGDPVFNTGADSVKGENVQRDRREAFLVDEEVSPYGCVQTEGIVTFSTGLDETLPWSTATGGRYMGADNDEQFGNRNAVSGDLRLRIRRVKTVAQEEIAS